MARNRNWLTSASKAASADLKKKPYEGNTDMYCPLHSFYLKEKGKVVITCLQGHIKKLLRIATERKELIKKLNEEIQQLKSQGAKLEKATEIAV